MLLGDYAQQKQVGWEVIFSEHGFTGSRACITVKPQQELKGSTLDFFLQLVLRLKGGFNCVGKAPLKSQCKKYGIWEGKIKPHLGKVCIFLPTLFS